MIPWLRDWWVWLQAWAKHRTGRVDERALIQCVHPTPPGWSPCKNKTTYCLTCYTPYKC